MKFVMRSCRCSALTLIVSSAARSNGVFFSFGFGRLPVALQDGLVAGATSSSVPPDRGRIVR